MSILKTIAVAGLIGGLGGFVLPSEMAVSFAVGVGLTLGILD